MKNHLIIDAFIVFIVIIIEVTKAECFQNKVALVTGAAQGLGKGFSHTLLEKDAKVCLVDIDEQTGMATLQEFQHIFGDDKVKFYKADITSQEQLEGAFNYTKDSFGGLDIVINNAGIGGETADLWERTIDVNVKGTIRGTRLAIDNLRRDKGGSGGVIINVASMAGIRQFACAPTYCASKSSIIQYSLGMAKHPDLRNNGVRINVLAPSFVQTQLLENLRTKLSFCTIPGFAQSVIDLVGIMTVEYVAETTMELVNPDANKNGQVMIVSKKEGKKYLQ